MKNIIIITSLLAAGTLFANAATPQLEYKTTPDGTATPKNFEYGDGGETGFVLDLSGSTYYEAEVKNPNGFGNLTLKFQRGAEVYGLTFTGSNRNNSLLVNGSTLGGNVNLTNLDFYANIFSSSLASGTNISLDNSTLRFSNLTWNISDEDFGHALVNGTENSGVEVLSNSTLTLNFATQAALQKAVSESLDLFSNVTVDETSFSDIKIIVGETEISDYVATLNTADGTISFSSNVPEPSMFGLLAGLGALALAGTRRRRKTK